MLPVGKAGPAHHHVLQQAEVGHLVPAASVIEQDRGLHLIGLDATHIVGLLEDGGGEQASAHGAGSSSGLSAQREAVGLLL